MTELILHPKQEITSAIIEQTCAALELTATMTGSLKSLAPNIHWHYKKGKTKGTLEITLLTQTNQIALSCKQNRGGDWIDEVMNELQRMWK
ncbi:MAG: hypothetical protein V4615_10245 [Bacteroidota bacterium]